MTRPISWLLALAQVVIFVAALIAASRVVVQIAMAVLGGEEAIPPYLVPAIAVAILIVAAGAFLLKVPAVKKVVYGLPARLKRLVFIACDSARTISFSKQPLCLAVTSDFRKLKVSHPSQKRLVESIFARIKEEKDEIGTYDVVLAPSGFGKTRTATLLAETLIRDKDLCILADNIHYYDFSRGFAIQHLFLKRLGGLAQVDAVVIVDNFHQAQPSIIQETTRRLLDVLNTTTERHILILAQPLDNWRLRAGSEIRLLSKARETGRLHSISALTRSDISKTQLSADVMSRIRAFSDYSSSGTASIAEIQAVQIDQTTSDHQRQLALKVSEYLFASKRAGVVPPSQRLVIAVAVATALAIFKGAFTKEHFRKAFWQANPKGGVTRYWDCIRVSGELRLLAKVGIVPKSSLPGGMLIMHERLATHLRDSLGTVDRCFDEAFRSALRWRLKNTDCDADPTLHWLGGVELRDPERLEKFFGRAMNEGNLQTMGTRLSRAIGYFDGPQTKFQLGTILDKSGSFHEARQHLSSITEGSSLVGFSALATLALLEADHGPDRMKVTSKLQQSSEAFVSLSGKYWEIHMRAHNGQFDREGLFKLGAEVARAFPKEEIANDFFLSTLCSRIYFDTLRHTFLDGYDIVAKIMENDSSPIANIVAGSDPCFKASTLLYERAHVLSFVLLPALAIFGERLEAMQTLGLGPHTGELSELCARVETEYRNAQDEFALFGNREQYYLNGDILNAQIQNPQSDPSELRIKLIEYEKFIVDSGFQDLASYPYVYAFRLAVRLRHDALQDRDVYDRGHDRIDELEYEARKALKKIATLDRACDNRYGLWRQKLYESLFDSVTKPNKARKKSTIKSLNALKDSAVKQGYRRDAAFIQKLTETGGLKYITVVRALIYHPFVHQ